MRKLFLLSLLTFVFAESASAAVSCYQFEMQESAEKTSTPGLLKQTWCYRSLASPTGAVQIFDSENPRPELSAIVETDGTVTHGNLIKGKVTSSRVHLDDVNPLPVPLTEPTDRQAVSVDVDQTKLDEMASFLIRDKKESRAIQIEEGTFTAAVPSANLPWRGYWWPFRSNKMWQGPNSPMAKYDRYVRARTGVSPGAQNWEATYHENDGSSWGGHCNGWAASAILRAEPNRRRVHAASGVSFSVGDQKGILAEEDFCARVAFYGRRNYGNPSNDPKDIYPAEFHRVISYYVGQLGKVVAVDYLSSLVVDTHLISGYTFNIRKQSANTYSVTARLRVHRYDRSPDIPPGIAPTYTRTYRYILRVNAAGQPISGTWLSSNPDFLWVPLSPVDCSSNNPRMRAQFVSEILRLPSATREQ